MSKELYLNVEDEAAFLVERTGCSLEEANLYLEGEEEYLHTLGLSGLEGEDGMLTAEEAANTVVYDDDVKNYIIEHKGLERGLVDRLSDYSDVYMKYHGFITF